jgi:hypothetical protein
VTKALWLLGNFLVLTSGQHEITIMDKKYQVFVSSTFSDLEDARNKVMETILKMYHFPVGMELFSAADSNQWKIITKDIDSSDYYVLIIGHRYGSISPEDGISYTEKEYDYAKENGVPILVFVRNRDAATTPSERDNQEEKLNAFINKATGDGRIRDSWLEISELCIKVQNALYKAFNENDRIGWTRGNLNSEQIVEELTLLNKENRTLRERNTELESKIREEKPCIEILLDSESKLTLNIPSIFPSMIIERPKPFCDLDIPEHLESYISSSDISNYNAKIPSQEIIDEYNDKKRLRWLEYNTKPLSIFIQNIGSCKANDVNIVIKFPNNVLVLSVKNKNKIELPKSPLPLTPIEKAERTIKEEQERQKNTTLLSVPSHRIDILNMENPLDRITNSMANLNRAEKIEVNGNTVEISVKSLLHTKGYNFDDIILIPTKEGIEYAEVSVICEEFRENETMQIEINVTKS